MLLFYLGQNKPKNNKMHREMWRASEMLLIPPSEIFSSLVSVQKAKRSVFLCRVKIRLYELHGRNPILRFDSYIYIYVHSSLSVYIQTGREWLISHVLR